jgi:hypothetical protein
MKPDNCWHLVRGPETDWTIGTIFNPPPPHSQFFSDIRDNTPLFEGFARLSFQEQ